MASDMVGGILEAISYDDCSEPGSYGLANYQWLSALDGTSPVSKETIITVLV